jgi:hypothetical protein
MVAVLAARIAEFGVEGSGLGSYYANRIETGQAFSADDRMLLQVLSGSFHDYGEIVEAAAGFGQLGLALAALGRRVICIEVSKARFDCMSALKAGLETKYPSIAQNTGLVHGAWPQVLAPFDASTSLFVAADFVFSGPPTAQAEALDALKRHKGAIIDVVHFVHTRIKRDEREAFYAAMQAAGLAKPEPLGGKSASGNSEFVFTRPAT